MSNRNQPHHNSRAYKRIAPIIRRAAYNQPDYRCPYCQLTLEEMRRTRPNQVIGWDCGHIVDGDDSYGYRAECSYCNRSNGSIRRNRKQPKPTTSRQWGLE